MLTTGDLETRDGKTFITFARNPVLVPAPVADLLAELAARARTMPTAATVDGAHYLFPSPTTPGVPLGARGLGASLTSIDIPTRVSRNSALFTLAADLPAPVAADLLGLHIDTMTRWADYTRRDWAHYLAARQDGR